MYAPAPTPDSEILAEFSRRVDAVTADRQKGTALRDAALIEALTKKIQRPKSAETEPHENQHDHQNR
jgi:hypothetical protein